MESILEQLRTDGQNALKAVYHDHRNEFVQWAQHHYQCPEDEALDIFQQAVIVLYENVMQNRLVMLSSSLKTYLFSIGKNKLMEYKRSQDKKVGLDGMDFFSVETEPDESLFKRAKEAVRLLGQPCRGMLIDFYYRGRSMRQLAETYGYKNEATAKTQKYRCLDSLRKIFKERTLTREA